MIELLLEAERALTGDLVDQAERLYWQAVEGDPRNAIAVVGLARVALARDDEMTALEFGRQALAIDPDNVAAQRLVARLAETALIASEPAPTAAHLPDASPTSHTQPRRPSLVRRIFGGS